MENVVDIKTRKPFVREEPPTQEKPKEGLYLDTLKAKRDVLSSHYTLNQLRKGKKIEEMSDTDIEDYKSVKREYDKRKELFFASFDNLSEDDGQKVAELTSLIKVEIELSKLEKPAETETVAPEVTPAPEGVDQSVIETPVRQTPEDIAGETRIHLGEELAGVGAETVISPVDAENPDRGTTMDEVNRMLKYSQDTARPLETTYWEAKKAELLERQEAEANPDRPAPKGFMQRVRDSYNRAKDALVGANAISGGSESVESRMSPLGLRKEAMESLSPAEPEPTQEVGSPTENVGVEPAQPTQPEATPQQLEQEPIKASKWGWLKERGKGVWNFGIWEFHQAERFRSKTKEVANETKKLATSIQQERNLSLEEAEKEAWETVEELKKNDLDISASEFYQANKDLTERKSKENDQEIEYIIKSAGNALVDKLAKYRGESGQDVLTLENKAAFEADLRGELNKMRDGAVRKDFVNFAKVMRRNLDEKWWRRYVWGSVEALAWAGVGWASMKFLAAEKAVGAGKAGVGITEQFVAEGMHKSVWHSLEQMAQNGPGHFAPTPEQLTQWSKAVAETNHWYEPEWVKGIIEGLRSTRMLPEGTVMKVPLWIMKAMGY